MSLEKIISGGQTGADRAGLAAGAFLKLHDSTFQTGGTAPPGWKSDEGPRESLLRGYGMVEGEPDPMTYPKRTRRNVADSDGTAIFMPSPSRGSKLTIRYCIEMGKPFCIDPNDDELRGFVERYDIKVLNVAGNRERISPGIFDHVYETIILAFWKDSAPIK